MLDELQIIINKKKEQLDRKKKELEILLLDIRDIETEYSSLKLIYDKSPKKKLRNKIYIKCPNGCGAERKYRKGFKSHLGFGEDAVRNCRKINRVIKTEEDLNHFFIVNNIE